jgi:hypothetical protein
MLAEATAPATPLAADELSYRRVLRALRARRRYRYVRPEVRRQDDDFIVVSPCCSRNVARDGGVIAIAWLERMDARWRLHRRDHAHDRWVACLDGPLPRLLDVLCADPERAFWP